MTVSTRNLSVSTQRMMPSNWVTMLVGWTFVVIGLFSAFVPLLRGSSPTVASFAGPTGLVVFGWLALVPRVYGAISLKGFLATLVAYALLFLGTFALVQARTYDQILPLYAGMIALAYGAKKRDPMLPANARKVYADPAAQALSSDTLFTYVIVLVFLLSTFAMRQEPVSIGVIGAAAKQMFDALSATGFAASVLKSILETLIGNFQIEYYAYSVAALFWLASENTAQERFIPPRAASWAILLTGVAILVMGIVGLFRSNGALPAMVSATVGSLTGAAVMFIADRQLGIRVALTSRRLSRQNVPSYVPLASPAIPIKAPAAQATASTQPTPQSAASQQQQQQSLQPGESPLPPYLL